MKASAQPAVAGAFIWPGERVSLPTVPAGVISAIISAGRGFIADGNSQLPFFILYTLPQPFHTASITAC